MHNVLWKFSYVCEDTNQYTVGAQISWLEI